MSLGRRLRIVAGIVISTMPALSALSGGWSSAHADGYIAQKPYHYLNPPPALKRGNHKPTSGQKVAPMKKGRSIPSFTLFTQDGQAGLGAHTGAFAGALSARSVTIRIRPVNLPKPLPKPYIVDGNAYQMTAIVSPGGKGARVTQKIGLVMRWPLLPYAILTYSGGKWREVCNANNRDWQINLLIVVCHTPTLGIFVAARRG